jgi:hypothetical protein
MAVLGTDSRSEVLLLTNAVHPSIEQIELQTQQNQANY